MAAKVKSYWTGDQFVTAIVGEPGRKFTPVIWIDSPVALHKVPNATAAQSVRDVDYPFPFPVKRAARTMLRAGKRLGITKAAKQFLGEVTRS